VTVSPGVMRFELWMNAQFRCKACHYRWDSPDGWEVVEVKDDGTEHVLVEID
jgi:hypothetical protein